MFDRSGVMFHDCAYHEQPDTFCAILSVIAGTDINTLGFDVTMDTIGSSRRIGMPMYQGICYISKAEIFRSYSLLGQGVVLWAATSQPPAPHGEVLIKDSWVVNPGFEPSVLEHARQRGIIRGVGQIAKIGSVYAMTPIYRDSINENRRLDPDLPPNSHPGLLNRTHYRMVYGTRGAPIEHFCSPRDLLVAFRDAIQGAYFSM